MFYFYLLINMKKKNVLSTVATSNYFILVIFCIVAEKKTNYSLCGPEIKHLFILLKCLLWLLVFFIHDKNIFKGFQSKGFRISKTTFVNVLRDKGATKPPTK
jgi:hypothetical protein